MELQLKVLIGNSKGQTIKIPGPQFLVGRSEDCQLRPRSDLISRHHCALIVDDRYFAIRDFGSKNGTYVNGDRVSGERELEPGDKLKIGPLEFEVVLDESLGGKKHPKVTTIKEAAARTAESKVEPAATDDDASVDEWLSDESVDGTETREMRATETLDISTIDTTSTTPVPPPAEDEKPKQPKKLPPGKMAPLPKSTSENSEQAAADMLRKLRKFR